ncbi:STAS domain-containing protein [Streptomyces sp. NPDC088794]|uniref:STAS domain-containing protein n=1 Tax=Streptomyces sp. NPDC088794 TaxID=3365902 RepID=UPI003804FAC8
MEDRPTPLRVDIRSTDRSVVVLEAVGGIDAFSASTLRLPFRGLLEAGNRHFVIDFGRVELLDGVVGIRAVARVWLAIKARGGTLALAGPSSVREAVLAAGLQHTLTVHDTVDEAIRAHVEP